MTTAEGVEWVERLGGWAVVVWIVWWLTKRWETQMSDLIKVVGKLAAGLSEAKAEEEVTLEKIHHKLDTVVHHINTKRTEA